MPTKTQVAEAQPTVEDVATAEQAANQAAADALEGTSGEAVLMGYPMEHPMSYRRGAADLVGAGLWGQDGRMTTKGEAVKKILIDERDRMISEARNPE